MTLLRENLNLTCPHPKKLWLLLGYSSHKYTSSCLYLPRNALDVLLSAYQIEKNVTLISVLCVCVGGGGSI